MLSRNIAIFRACTSLYALVNFTILRLSVYFPRTIFARAVAVANSRTYTDGRIIRAVNDGNDRGATEKDARGRVIRRMKFGFIGFGPRGEIFRPIEDDSTS